MHCAACGQSIGGPAAFCRHCGARLNLPAAPPLGLAERRVHRHLQTLGILWFVYGAYRAATGIFAALIVEGIMPRVGFGPWDVPGE